MTAPRVDTLTTSRESEKEIQRVFEAWNFDAPGGETWRVGDYALAGFPSWLRPSRRSLSPRQLRTALDYDFRPDLVWEAGDESFVIELKSAAKYEPLALPEVLHHARAFAKLARKAERVTPVMVTQYNVWLREALDYLFEKGLARDALRYLEFQALHGPRVGDNNGRILWFDEPFAPWERSQPTTDVAALASAMLPACRSWHYVQTTRTWVITEHAMDARPLFIDGSYGMIAAVGPRSYVLWSGSDSDQGTYHLCSYDADRRVPRLASPRLAHADDVADFQMDILECAGRDA